MPVQGQTQTVLHLLCHINTDFCLHSFIPRLKHLLLSATAKGWLYRLSLALNPQFGHLQPPLSRSWAFSPVEPGLHLEGGVSDSAFLTALLLCSLLSSCAALSCFSNFCCMLLKTDHQMMGSSYITQPSKLKVCWFWHNNITSFSRLLRLWYLWLPNALLYPIKSFTYLNLG